MSENELTTKKLNQIDYAIGGAFGGFISRVVVQPLDVLKIRFQLQVEPINVASNGKYSGVIQAIVSIRKEEGLKAFWKGHFSSQIQAVSFSLIQFSVFGLCSKYFSEKVVFDHEKLVAPLIQWRTFVFGAVAGAISTIFTQPFDVLRTRFVSQGEPKVYKNLVTALAMIIKNEGIPGFFRGLVPSLLLIVPQTGFQFFFYHLSNHIISDYFIKPRSESGGIKEVTKIGIFQSALSGGIAGSIAKVCVYPLDIVKKRMQVQGFEIARSKFGRLHISNGFFKCIKVVFSGEGFGGFFKGLQTSLLKSFVCLGLRFSVYEQVCNGILSLRAN